MMKFEPTGSMDTHISQNRQAQYLIWWCLLSITWAVNAGTITISGDDVNVRSGPGRTYDVIDIVAQHEQFEVLEDRDGWYKISVEGRVGWISGRSASIHGEQTIDDLIARADRYFRQRQFITPADANAFDLYQEVLRLDPDQSHARHQIDEMARIYKSWSDIAAQRGDDDTARVYYERYLFLTPNATAQQRARLSFQSNTASSIAQPLRIYQLRATPADVSVDALRKMIREYQFNHPADWSKYDLSASITGTIRHHYERLIAADGVTVVADYATNLIWQHSSPPKPLAWNEAHAYVQQLNSTRYGGSADWRLPTIEELASLLESTKSSNNLYLDPTFGTTQLWCWSADSVASAGGHAWYVSFSSGGIQPHQTQASAFVLAVRTLRQRTP